MESKTGGKGRTRATVPLLTRLMSFGLGPPAVAFILIPMLILMLSLGLGLGPGGGLHLHAEEPGIEIEEAEEAVAKLTVASVTAQPEEETTIPVSIAQVPPPGLASIQGEIKVDPEVVQVQEVIFAEEFNIAVKNIQTSSVRFAATLTADRAAILEGTLLELKVKAVGQPGDQCEVALTVEVLSDLDYNPIPYEVTPGLFKIEAINLPPVADFTFTPEAPTTDEPVQFTDRSHDPDGEIVEWLWDFGDGTTSTEQNPSHRYAQPGHYTVTLTVTDDRGATATATEELVVLPAVTEITVICYPNPASDGVTFRYYLPRGTRRATLLVFDITGVLVFSRELRLDEFEFVWDLKDNRGKPLPNGLYFYFIAGLDREGRPIRSKPDKLVIQR